MGLGLTVIKNVTGVPLQPLAVGVTVIVAVIGEFPVFVAVNGLMSPVPDAGNQAICTGASSPAKACARDCAIESYGCT